jgi:hypothetical protein
METNVWTRLFAQAATFLSSLSAYLSKPNQASGGLSPNVPASDADSTSTSKSVTSPAQALLSVKRNPTLATADALFGTMDYNGTVIGVTMERTAVAIPLGTYKGYKRDSEHFGMKVVGIDVPNRTNIECHPANEPCQLLGCIAIGESKDGDALNNSKAAFDQMMLAVPDEFTVTVA